MAARRRQGGRPQAGMLHVLLEHASKTCTSSYSQPPGLHNPPLPEFPTNVNVQAHLPKVPRDELHQAKWWTPPAKGMGTPRPSRPVQARSWPSDVAHKELTEERRQWVKRGFLHAWEGYKARKCRGKISFDLADLSSPVKRCLWSG